MKKILSGLLALVVASSAAYFFLKRSVIHRSRAAELVPAETIFFAQAPDLVRTTWRWQDTALAQIWAEPEMQAFFKKPRETWPAMKSLDQKFDTLRRVAPSEAFFAVTSIDGPQPKVIGGFAFYGRKSDAIQLLKEPNDTLRAAFPAGKSDVTEYDGVQIETFAYQDSIVAEAFKKDWCFISNDLALIKATLDAAGHESNPNSLGAQEIFKKTIAPIPTAGDSLLFAQVGVLSERLISLMAASGQPVDPKQLAELKKIQAVGWGTKIEGTQWRDTVFVLNPGEPGQAAMARSAAAFTSPQTVLYYATGVPASLELPQSSMAMAAFIPGLQAMDGALAAQKLKWSDFGKAFGPEFGAIVDWTPDSLQPSGLFALDVRDAGKAKGFADALTSGAGGAGGWGRKEEDGATLYQSPGDGGLLGITPSLALTDRFLVIGLSLDSVKHGLLRLKKGTAGIAASPEYQAAEKLVPAPTSSFGYLDVKGLFERSYGSLRPLIAMSIAFNPQTGRYIDASKLPNSATIARHLGPSIYSQSMTPDGTLAQSVGPLTFNQVLVAGLGGGIAAALPMIENTLSGGFKLDPNLLQMKPSAPLPAATPSPVPASPTNSTPPDPAPATPPPAVQPATSATPSPGGAVPPSSEK